MLKSIIKGFSLLELVVVLAVMGTLAAVAVPAFNAVTGNSASGALVSSADGLVKSGTSVAQSDPLNPGRGVSILDIDISDAGDAVLSNGAITVFGQKDQCITISVSGSNSDAVFVVSDVKVSSNVATDSAGKVTGGQCAATASATTPTTNAPATTTTTNAPATTTTVALVVYAIGDTGPGGGIIIITPSTAGNSTGKYFEAAPFASEVQRSWATNVNSNQTTAVSGADGTAIGTGAQNTIDIVAQSGNVAATSAAAYASDYSNGGYSDWFLPSKDELDQLYTHKTTVGGFAADAYWSSSEYDTTDGWYRYFSHGFQFGASKSNPGYVRPVRSF